MPDGMRSPSGNTALVLSGCESLLVLPEKPGLLDRYQYPQDNNLCNRLNVCRPSVPVSCAVVLLAMPLMLVELVATESSCSL